jgi:N4-(beta-N-acetylglucosaminyl)-L-asparaginase
MANPVVTDVVDRSEVGPKAFAGRPVIISSDNGAATDDNGKRGLQVAWDILSKGGDPLDACVAGVQIVELDPHDQSVGFGGLPNEEGVVQLDASVMHGPTKRSGSVACLEDIATPAAVARDVMNYTDHIMLVGEGAKKFALKMGYKTQNLLTEQSRIDWLSWRSGLNGSDNWLDISRDTTRGARPGSSPPPSSDFRRSLGNRSRGNPREKSCGQHTPHTITSRFRGLGHPRAA